ncbi:carbamoyl phosphate synthase large subunit [Desulfosarcina alkanivorans]|uniref:Carbamoyl phosphate synthase large subunit n=1 Tax=Desulfosarcina alkanivorans TaxID=571177 RepID=A0A5K7YCM9_9BACT|nr:carbamoyl-phosphate synthase large subunit [Desulfosarcina alkanivorans]BBO66175.1 carbamoyl phosphate synthase large subunit [Desulfosarcina alkanivorans]
MPTPSMKKVLIIGSGPVRIGQPGAFDDAACRACEIFRKAGIQTVMVHCDPSALAADIETADRTYLVPLTVGAVMEVILREKPDALLPTVGGTTALALANAFVGSGLLRDNHIHLLGISEKTLAATDTPTAFCKLVAELGLAAPDGQSAGNLSDAATIAERIGYPVFVRAAEPDRPQRYGIAFNVEELRMLAAGGRLPADTTGDFRIEQALSGYREIEVEMLRDRDNQMILVGMAENLDSVGVHSGDSTVVIPPATINAGTRRQIASAAFKLAGHIEVTGAVHVKFAVAPERDQVFVLAVNPRFSATAAFFSKAFGIPLPTLHARLSLGAGLDELRTEIDFSSAGPETGEVVAVRLPRWEFDRFPGEANRLDARMKSTGAVMGLGRSFLEALQKAVRSRSPKHPILGGRPELAPLDADTLMRRLVVPSPDRLQLIHEALKKGAGPEAVADITGIGIEWIRQLADLAEMEQQLAAGAGKMPPPSLIENAVAAGFSEDGLSLLLDMPAPSIGDLLSDAGVRIRPHASGDPAYSPVWFNTSANGMAPHAPMGKTVLLVCPGSGRIGQNIELDHCCVHGARALRAAGRSVAMISGNPASACGLNDADRIYVDPLTATDIKAVCRSERPEGVILQFGGHGAMDLARELVADGVPVWGTAHEQAALSQDRLRFSELLTGLGIPHPQLGVADTPEQAMNMAESIGYPLVARPAADRLAKRRTIVMDARMMEHHVIDTAVSPESPIMLEQFLEYAIEVEADALCDGRAVYLPAVMEHIELAGVHSGDAAIVVPPYSTPPRHVETIRAIVNKVALELNVKGVLNTRFAVYNDTVYLLEARPWACRTLPLISTICNVPMAERAVEIMLGMSLDEMDLPRRLLPHYGIRSSVFPFDTFTETDPLLGPRMRSTGQVLTLADVFGTAYFTSQEAAAPPLPLSGKVLITVTDADKPSILEPARLFREMGFDIQATRGTHAFLKKNGIDAQLVKKLGFGRPDLVDGIKTGEVALVVNTPSGRQSHQDDAYIRKTAIRYQIPDITTPAGALAAAKGIAARKQCQDALYTLQSYVRSLK